ncbi:hypothetical protein HUO13_21380 [Saccharopolyspora erythraea]|uniref:hypothetical protein n=1 Tax=Saccharopolyspora erythraea TaxID=1836 RepID=UPI001BAA444C|nr:hypothetical protein [Saccharopolyspora erythraea]QUH03032.1 hypothetical protein HUO13_21380 [Saccharopolyspora erythraea]
MGDVRVRLRGGPEDGREISVAADASGMPVPRVTLPARRAHGSPGAADQHAPLLAYERRRSASDGVWEFGFVGTETD